MLRFDFYLKNNCKPASMTCSLVLIFHYFPPSSVIHDFYFNSQFPVQRNHVLCSQSLYYIEINKIKCWRI